MKKLRRILSLVLALTTLVLLLAAPASALTTAKKVVVYLDKKYTWNNNGWFWIDNLKKGETIKAGSVKSSNSKVVKVTGYSYNTNSHTDLENKSSSSKSYSAGVNFRALKTGTAKISYTIGKKTYSTTVEVKAFANPLKTLTIPGVNGGKNLASGFKNTSDVYNKSFGGGKKGVITLQAASGWKITSCSLYSQKTDQETEIYCWTGVSKAYIPLHTALNKNQSYYVSARLENKKTGGTIGVTYYLGKYYG